MIVTFSMHSSSFIALQIHGFGYICIAQAMLLKANFRFKQGRTTEAKKILKKVLKTSKTTGMTYLKKMAESLLPELVVL